MASNKYALGCIEMVLLLAMVPSAEGEVRVAEQQRRFLLDAHRQAPFREQLSDYLEQRGRGHASRSHGLTNSSFETRYTLWLDKSGCALSDVRVELQIELALPHWKPKEDATQELRVRGNAMLSQLSAHGAGHRLNALATASAIERQLEAIPPMADCKQARSAAERIVSNELLQLKIRDSRFDQASNAKVRRGPTLDDLTPEQQVERDGFDKKKSRITSPKNLQAVGM